jgi:hypothetical protein
MFGGIKGKKPVSRTVNQRARGHHFGVEARPVAQSTMEEPAEPIREIHHWCYAETPSIIHTSYFTRYDGINP